MASKTVSKKAPAKKVIKKTLPCGNPKSDTIKQWCPDPECDFHIKPQVCSMCENYTGINKERTGRNAICYFCHNYCRENHVCITPGCNKQTTEKPDKSGYFWAFCNECAKQTKDAVSVSSKPWSNYQEADPISHCIFCNSDDIPDTWAPACKVCQDTIKKNDPDNWRQYMWNGTCLIHKNPQFGNTVCCSVCGENQKGQFTNQCQECKHWLSSDDACSMCQGKTSLEFTKVKPAKTKAVHVHRLITGSKPVDAELKYSAILKREPSKEVTKEVTPEKSDDEDQAEESESKGSVPPPSPELKPQEQPKPIEQSKPTPELKLPGQEKVKVTFKSIHYGTVINVTAFGKEATYHMHTGNYEANQEDGVYTVTFKEYNTNSTTLRIVADQVAKTISFIF